MPIKKPITPKTKKEIKAHNKPILEAREKEKELRAKEFFKKKGDSFKKIQKEKNKQLERTDVIKFFQEALNQNDPKRYLYSKGVKLKDFVKLYNGEALKKIGYNANDLYHSNYLSKLNATQKIKFLIERSYPPKDIININLKLRGVSENIFKKEILNLIIQRYPSNNLKELGLNINQLYKAGISLDKILKSSTGKTVFTIKEMIDAKIPIKQIYNEIYYKPHRPITYELKDFLKLLKKSGVTAKQFREFLSLTTRNAKRIRARDFKSLKFSPIELRKSGYTAIEMKEMGFSGKVLRKLNFTAKEMRDAGYSIKDLKKLKYTLKNLADANFTATQLHENGFTLKQLKEVGFIAENIMPITRSYAKMKELGFTALELYNMNAPDRYPPEVWNNYYKEYFPAEVPNDFFIRPSLQDLKDLGYSKQEINKAIAYRNRFKKK